MGFTWIHLNQVNLGTDAGIGCAPYQCWCISFRVGTCAAINTCLKCEKWHTKESSLQKKSSVLKENNLYGLLKKDLMPRTKMRGRGGTTTLAREVHPSKTTFGSFGHPNSLVQKVRKVVWEGTGAHTPVLGML